MIPSFSAYREFHRNCANPHDPGSLEHIVRAVEAEVTGEPSSLFGQIVTKVEIKIIANSGYLGLHYRTNDAGYHFCLGH
jgi:hypothetical protein